MKKLTIALAAAMLAAGAADAQNLAGKKIYLNPGHGGYEASCGAVVPGQFANGYRSDGSTATDRWVSTIPYPNICEEGVWESKHNLWRGLELQRLLEGAGASVMMSRTQNRPEDDRILVTIGEEATNWQADMFLSIHSNASGTNYLMTMFRGADPRPGQPFNIADPDLAESKVMAETGWKHLHDNILTCWQARKDPNAPYAVADSAAYTNWNGAGNGYHLGVLRKMWRPGFLAEIAFHDYKPEAHRMLSRDYSNIIAYMLFTGICDHFKAGMPATGIIAGEAKDGKRLFRDPLYTGASAGDHDQYKPINGATVTLTGNGVTKTYVTDNNYNGIYYFPDLQPGTYHLKIEAEGYDTYENDVVCEAAKVRGDIAMLNDPAYDPASDMGHANVYASALEVVAANTIRFTLNSDATSVAINLYKNGQLVKTIDLGPQAQGVNTVEVPESDLAEGDYTWSLTAKGTKAEKMAELDLTTYPDLLMGNARGLAIDVYPASPAFGTMYLSNPVNVSKKAARTAAGVYGFSADMQTLNAEPWTDGLVLASGNSAPYSLTVADNGEVFVADWSDGSGGVSIMNPATHKFSPVFADGDRDANTGLVSIGGTAVHGSVQHVAVVGQGADRILYTRDEDMPEGDNIYQYNIGNLDQPWSAAPTRNLGKPYANGNNRIIPDGRGGMWVSQYRYTESEAYPCVFHLNANFEVDFQTGDKSIFVGNACVGDMAVSPDGSMMAMADGTTKMVTVAKITWNGNVPSLEKLCESTYSKASARPFNVAFDYANNLYAVFNDDELNGGVTGWVIPVENESTTPAMATLRVTSGVDDITADSEAGISYFMGTLNAHGAEMQVYTAAGVLVAQGYVLETAGWENGVYIVRAGNHTLKIVK